MKSRKTSSGNTKPGEGLKGSYHIPVLFQEALDGLAVRKDGIYVDCTFGGGGHAAGILTAIGEKGRLIAFDQDEDARRNLPVDDRLLFIPENFRHIQRFLRLHNAGPVDGILADLGVSSHQFDTAERGFSTRFDAALDMRMDKRQSLTAHDVINTYDEAGLQRIFGQYGEVTNAKTLARTIVAVRNRVPLNSVDAFRNALREQAKGNPHKYFAQVFQALRIEVNDELGALKELLRQIPSLLKPGGRAVIITFHSLEDRLVKNFFRRGSFDEPEENPFFNEEKETELRVITKKPVIPSEKEIRENPRSRSARMRIAEKIT